MIGERFRLLDRLGAGGFGVVWSAFDERLGVEVAIKEVRVDPAASEAERAIVLEQVENEARNAARLRDHPNIVTVYDVVTEGGVSWLVMRLVRGSTLAQVIAERGQLEPQETGRIAAGVLAALSAAHAAGIVHRDVKPANIMLAGDAVLLTDFGTAKQHTNTTQAVLLGTLPYMSPERLNGKDLPASDMFALGVTLYEMTVGVSPFARESATAIMAAVAVDQPAPPDRAGHLSPLILALLEKDPVKRPTADEALRLLDFRGNRPTIAMPLQAASIPATLQAVGPTATFSPPPGIDQHRVRLRLKLLGAAIGVVAGVVAATVALWPTSVPSAPTTPQSAAVPQPVGWWKLDQATGTEISDDSQHGNAAVATDVVWQDGAAAFAGSSSQQITTRRSVVDVTRNFSVAAWVNLTSTASQYQTAVSEDATTSSGFYLQFFQGRWAFSKVFADAADSDAARSFSAGPPSTGSWTHLVGVFNAGNQTLTLYVDGVAQTPVTAPTPFAANGPLAIGRALYNGAPTDFLDGEISDVRLYSQALSADEVEALFKSSKTGHRR